MAEGLQAAVNYMIPAVGTPRMFIKSQVFDPLTPVVINFRGVMGGMIDAQPFRPSGLLIDNSQGVGPLTVRINEAAFSITVPIGGGCNMPFPAPVEMTSTITGDGQATVVFVDYPVMPIFY